MKCEYISHNIKNKISIIFACFGRYEIVEHKLNRTLETLFQIKNSVDIILVLDGSHWMDAPLIYTLKTKLPGVQFVQIENECNRPAHLYNEGLKHVDTEFVCFAYPGCNLSKENIGKFEAALSSGEDEDVYYLTKPKLNRLPFYPNDALRYGWCQCEKVFDFDQLLVSNKVFQEIGDFDCSQIVQQYFDWDFMIRLSRKYRFKEAGMVEGGDGLSLKEYPYTRPHTLSKDIVHRYIIRQKDGFPVELDGTSPHEAAFLKDLPAEDRDYIKRATQIEADNSMKSPQQRNYKITIVGGFWEYIHNQLCFYNYLDELYGKQFATYKVAFDFLLTVDDIRTSDLVIFSRCRDPKILDIIDYCNKNNIATLYMIDDNWLWVGKDWPEDYGKLFCPGNPNYDVFIEALGKCRGVLLYNRYLHEDVQPYARKVYQIPVNINLDFYKSKGQSSKDDSLIIGYTGSARYNNESFEALAEVAKENGNIKVLLFGVITEEQKQLFKDVPLISIGYKSYFDYCKEIARISPTILLAPLDSCRTSMSKCPNKYLEITAAGSVGIYTNIHPYNEVVKDGFNGFLVDSNTKTAWKDKLRQVLKNKQQIPQIRKNGERDVKDKFATTSVMATFCKVIDSITGEVKND